MTKEFFFYESAQYEVESTPYRVPVAKADGKLSGEWIEPIVTGTEFSSNRAKNKAQYAGSGFVEFGKSYSFASIIAEGMSVNANADYIRLGRTAASGQTGSSKTTNAIVNCNGILIKLAGSSGTLEDHEPNLQFPQAPSTSSLQSRQDLCFLEVWFEDVTEKDIVYPLGNVQCLLNAYQGITLTDTLVPASYSAFGAWDTSPTAGKGVRWSTLGSADRNKFLRDPYNNIFSQNSTYIQVRWRLRTVPGLRDDWSRLDSTSIPFKSREQTDEPINPSFGTVLYCTDPTTNRVESQGKQNSIASDFYNGLSYGFTSSTNYSFDPGDKGVWTSLVGAPNTSRSYEHVYAIPICMVQRRNSGAYHPSYNPQGCARFTDGNWNVTSLATSTQSCFDNASGGTVSSGISGRPDGAYYDEIRPNDVRDLRVNCKKVRDNKSLLAKSLTKYQGNKARAWEGESVTQVIDCPGGNPMFLPTVAPGQHIKLYTAQHPTAGQFQTNINHYEVRIGDTVRITSGDAFLEYTVTGYQSTVQSIEGTITRIVGDFNSKLKVGTAGGAYRDFVSVGTVTYASHTRYSSYKRSNGYHNYMFHDILGGISIDDNITYDLSALASADPAAEVDRIVRTTSDLGNVRYYVINSIGNLAYNATTDTLTGTATFTETVATNHGIGQEVVDGVVGMPVTANISDGSSQLPKNVPTVQVDGVDSKKFYLSRHFGIGSDIQVFVNDVEYSYGFSFTAGGKQFIDNRIEGSITIQWDELDDNAKIDVFYMTTAKNSEPCSNSTCLLVGAGEANTAWSNLHIATDLVGNKLTNGSLTGNKQGVNIRKFLIDSATTILDEDVSVRPNHDALTIGGTTEGYKFFTYLSRYRNMAYLNIVYEELNSNGASIGDDSEFSLVDYTLPTTNGNGDWIIVGQKRIPLNRII